jgi:hypothetical protein
MHEPLILALVLPFIPVFPWHLRNFPPSSGTGGTVHRLWSLLGPAAGSVLRHLCDLPSTLAGLSPGVVRGMLHPPPPG